MSTQLRTQAKTTLIPQSSFTPVWAGLLQRKCACGGSPGVDGECAECRSKRLASPRNLTDIPTIQTKLTVNQPGDRYEQEADHIAEQVMRMPELPSLSSGALQRRSAESNEDEKLHRQSMEDEKDEEETIQARETPGQTPQVTPALQTRIDSLRGGGQPLPESTRAFMEPRFGHDFSKVCIHTDAQAAETARAVNARAYTLGHNIVFGTGQYAPNTRVGQKLIVHELMHTIQQQSSQLAVVNSSAHGRGAETTDPVYSYRPIPTLRPMQSGLVSRQNLQPDESPKIGRSFELAPQLFPKLMDASDVTEGEKCEEFPGGSTDCEIDEKTGIATGKVIHSIDETNSCTKPCVEQHEAVHVKQFRTFCPKLRDCYRSAEKSKDPNLSSECAKMAIFGRPKKECPAYKVSILCLENRLKNAKECQSKENKVYGKRKLASEKCFRNKNCGGSGGK